MTIPADSNSRVKTINDHVDTVGIGISTMRA